MNATNRVEINEACEKIEKKREREKSEEIVRNETRDRRENKKGGERGIDGFNDAA